MNRAYARRAKSCKLLAGISDLAARLYYLRAAGHFGWSLDILLNQIKARANQLAVREKMSHNFTSALTQPFAAEGDEILKE